MSFFRSDKNVKQAYQDIDPQKFDELINSGNCEIIDVRTPEELDYGYIDGYKLINMYDPEFFNELEKIEKGKTYLIYCRSGARSARTCEIMFDMGYDNLYNLDGGILAWNRFKGK